METTKGGSLERGGFRWGWMRFVYGLNVLAAGVPGLLILFGPESLMSSVTQDRLYFGVLGSVWLSIGLLSILGLRDPLRFSAIFLVQIMYKGIWFMVVLLPLAVAGELRFDALPLVVFFALAIARLPRCYALQLSFRKEELVEATEINWLSNSRVSSAIGTLVRAFRDDPVACYLFPDDERRSRLMPWYLGSAARYCQPYGEVYATESLDGVAAWLPPGKTRVSNYWHMLRSGMLLAPLKVRPAEFSGSSLSGRTRKRPTSVGLQCDTGTCSCSASSRRVRVAESGDAVGADARAGRHRGQTAVLPGDAVRT